MTLADLQRRFLGEISAPDDSEVASVFPPAMQTGLAVYRNGYRARLLEAIKASFPRVQALVGEEGFAAAAAHHLILHPPSGWSLDEVGRGFDTTLKALFPNDPEVAELAWLEWEMQQMFVCADENALHPQEFARQVQHYSGEDWQHLRLQFRPGLQLRWMHSNCAATWEGAAGDTATEVSTEPALLLLWRQNLEPRFRLLDAEEADALRIMQPGGSFGEMCERLLASSGAHGVQLAGAILGRWVEQGLIKGVLDQAGTGAACRGATAI